MSQGRLDAFDKCKESSQLLAKTFDLTGVKYGAKLTPNQITGLANFLTGEKINTLDKLMRYSALKTADKILCRFPRPSELARVAIEMGVLDKSMGKPYWRACVHLDHTGDKQKKNAGKLVGIKGANLISLTEEHDLLYAWLKHEDVRKYCLCVYAKKEADVRRAAEHFALRAGRYNMAVTKIEVKDLILSPRSRDFAGSAPKKINPSWVKNGKFLDTNAPGIYVNSWADNANANSNSGSSSSWKLRTGAS